MRVDGFHCPVTVLPHCPGRFSFLQATVSQTRCGSARLPVMLLQRYTNLKSACPPGTFFHTVSECFEPDLRSCYSVLWQSLHRSFFPFFFPFLSIKIIVSSTRLRLSVPYCLTISSALACSFSHSSSVCAPWYSRNSFQRSV